MKSTSKYAIEPLAQSSRVLMKNKSRLSVMTAFSFGHQSKHLKTKQPHPIKKDNIKVFFLCFTSQNETLNNSLKQAQTVYIRTPK